MAAIITLMITAPLPGGALPVARLSETSLPEPALSEFPAPQKLELPKPNRLAEEDQIDDASQEEPDGLFSQIDRYLKSMLGN